MIFSGINGRQQAGLKSILLHEIEQVLLYATHEHREALLWFRERLRKH